MKNTLTILVSLFLYYGISAQTYFTEDFEPTGGSLTQNNAWTTEIITAHPDGYDWYHDDFSGDAFAKVSNYNATSSINSPMETWLISPLIDLSTASTPQLNFENVKRFAGDDLNVYISTDYITATPTNYTISTAGTSWSSPNITINVGDTVTWINTSGSHNVNGTTTTFPNNPQSFGNSVGSGWTYQFVFTVAGNYDFQCDPHASFGMTGTITVQPINSPTWTDLTGQLNMDSDISSWNFVNSGNLDLSPFISSSPSTVTLAFQYIGGASDGSTYEIDDILISEGGANPTTVSIYDIQFTTVNPADSPYMGQQINTGGIVTYVRADNTYYLQSGEGEWSGIYVYDTLSNVTEGDSITISCEVDEYFNLTELKNVNNLVIVSSGNTFSSNLVSSLQAASEEYEGCLVTVNTATCTNDNAGFGEWIINDGSGPCNVDDFFFPFTPTLNNIYNVTGLIDYSFSNFKILPRDIDDIDEITTIGENDLVRFSYYPNPAKDLLNMELQMDATIKITDLSGKTCYNKNFAKGNHIIDLQNFPKGNYIINIGEHVKKLLIQ